MNQNLIEKIKRLLSLAQSDNEHEAKAASAKASELLLKYNIDMQQVEDSGVEFDTLVLEKGWTVTMECKFVLQLVCEAFMVRNIIETEAVPTQPGKAKRRYMKPTLVGEKTTVQVALYTYEFLMRSFKEQFKEYMKKTGCDTKKRYSFYVGLNQGLKEQFKLVKQKVTEERGLVPCEDPRLDKFYRQKYPNTSYMSTARKPIDPHAYQNGKETGRNLTIRRGINEASQGPSRALNGGSSGHV